MPCAVDVSGQDALDAYLVAHDPSTGSVTLAISGTIPTSITSLAVIDAQTACRHFHVKFGAVLRLNYLHLINGRSTDLLEGGGSIRTYGIYAKLYNLPLSNVQDATSIPSVFNPTNDGTLAKITHCKFSHNYAYRGGVIQITGPNSGSSGSSGGAFPYLYMDGSSKVDISDSIFIDNTASNFAGTIEGIYYPLLDIKNTDFIRNKVLENGGGGSGNSRFGGGAGAMDLFICEYAEIINTTFIENDGFTIGGAIRLRRTALTCRGCAFDKNKLSQANSHLRAGGAFWIKQSILTLTDNTTVTNHGNSYTLNPRTDIESGGAIFSDGETTINFQGVTMMNSAANNGGAILAQQSKFVKTN